MKITMSIYTVSVVVLLIALFISWLKKRHDRLTVFLRQGIPGPKPNIILGNYDILRKDKGLLSFLKDALQVYGKTFFFCFIGKPALFISDLDLLQDVLVKNFHNYRNRALASTTKDFMQHNIFALKDENWKRVRATLAPSFSSAKLKTMMSGVMTQRTDYLIEEVNIHIRNQKPVEFYTLLQRLTLDVIAECAFAMNINSVKSLEEAKPLLNALTAVMQNGLSPLDFAFIPTSLRKLFMSKETIEADADKVKIKYYCEKILKERKNNVLSTPDMLQFMTETKLNGATGSLSEDEIIANTFVFLLAGYETTSTALAFVLLLLASHPQIQEQLYQEIIKNIPQPDKVTFDDVKSLRYIDQVWNESLRMYSPVSSMIGRVAAKTTTVGPTTVPAGSWVMISPMMIHNDPEYWPEPHRFLPERWNPENKQNIKPFSFLPFGDGPRQCIGKRFAEIEAKLTLVKIINCFELRPANKGNSHPVGIKASGPTIAPASGQILLTATPRAS